ncbi:MAG: hypothetical protein HWN65_05335 [Candidatus Helarchaeota archaeon]|nr:hypothetical protein [Candidatus Helarchaeota archaeon]
MGLWEKIKDELNPEFSLFQLMELLGMDEDDKREARNILNQFHITGKIARISKNMYRKLE